MDNAERTSWLPTRRLAASLSRGVSILLLSLSSATCGGHDEPHDSADGSGLMADGGQTRDAGPEAVVDGGQTRDAGLDATAPADAGVDAALPASDGGEPDARVDGGADASVQGPCFRSDATAECAEWIQVAGGNWHSCGIAGGALFCWGRNAYGELGTGDTVPHSPTQVGSETDWTTVSAGTERTCGIRAGGELYCWGRRGLPLTESDGSVMSPERVGSDADWRAIAVAHAYCGIRGEGELYCWGPDSYSTFDEPGAHIEQPRRVGSSTTWTAITAGSNAACGIDAGRLFCWGGNTFGQLGDGTDEGHGTPLQVGAFTDWTQVTFNVYGNYVCGLREGGALYCWGGFSEITQPTQVVEPSSWRDVAVGWISVCGLTTAGEAYCWGQNEKGQLGDGTFVTANAPKPIAPGVTWSRIHAGVATTFAIRDGALHAWGSNAYGLRGTPPDFGQVGNAADWLQVSAGGNGGCGVRSPGDLYCWGYSVSEPEPQRVGSARDWTQVAAYFSSWCGIRAGQLYCKTGQGAARQIGDDSDWTYVAYDSNHGCGLRAGGTLYCWINDFSDPSDPFVPTPIDGSDWTEITVDGQACGIRGGDMYCLRWPEPDLDPDLVVLTPIGPGQNWSKVSTASGASCAIDDGALYCWGSNDYGALGAGHTDSPVALMLIDDTHVWRDVSTEMGRSTCAVAEDGLLACAGFNGNGELALTDFVSRTTFTPSHVGGWQSVSMGPGMGCGLRDGRLYCWGDVGGTGQLTGLTPTPVRPPPP